MKQYEELIAATANATATATAARILSLRRSTNLYKATERILRMYPRLKRQVENVEEYGFVPAERSKSITVAPPSGGSVRDPIELIEDVVASRRRSYERTRARFEEIDSVIRMFDSEPEFIVIRMYYWGEDAHGNPREPSEKAYSFAELAEELEAIGMSRSERTLRSWRTQLVKDMTVALFGVDGALSVETREPVSAAPAKPEE